MATPIQSTKAAVTAHPTGTFTGAAGVVFGWLVSTAHLTPDQVGALIAGLGLLATFISYAAAHGGLRGLWREFVTGIKITS